jgi:hypothetical protein
MTFETILKRFKGEKSNLFSGLGMGKNGIDGMNGMG